MRIIPVLDVMGGQVVQAVGGRRFEYRPIESRLTPSTEPVAVAKKMAEVCGAKEIYVADLDAILGGNPGGQLAAALADELPKLKIWIDTGLRTEADLKTVPLMKPGTWKNLFSSQPRANIAPILASETIEGPTVVASARTAFDSRCLFSFDLQDGSLIGDWQAWRDWDVREATDLEAYARAVSVLLGGRVMLVIDLAHVGSGAGPGSGRSVERLKMTLPDVRIISGGGVRNPEDAQRLKDSGADAILVSRALHAGVCF